jgi:hypothetical protein
MLLFFSLVRIYLCLLLRGLLMALFVQRNLFHDLIRFAVIGPVMVFKSL